MGIKKLINDVFEKISKYRKECKKNRRILREIRIKIKKEYNEDERRLQVLEKEIKRELRNINKSLERLEYEAERLEERRQDRGFY